MMGIEKTFLHLTAFLKSINGDDGLEVQIKWKDVHLPTPVGRDSPVYTSSQIFSYRSHGFPSKANLDESFLIAAEVSTEATRYLVPKIHRFSSQVASYFDQRSPPSILILAELATVRTGDIEPEPIMPRRQVVFRQQRLRKLTTCFFYDDLARYVESGDVPLHVESDTRSLEVFSRLRRAQECQGRCSICMQDMTADVVTLPCRHTFHGECVMVWLDENETCPMCRDVLYVET